MFGAIALPWPYLYRDWIEALLGNIEDPIVLGLVPVPFIVRLPIALVLIAIQRPWTRALGAMLASPNLYWGQLVIVIAPLSLWIQERAERRANATLPVEATTRDADPATAPSPSP